MSEGQVIDGHARAVMSLWEELPSVSDMHVLEAGMGPSTQQLLNLQMKVTATTFANEAPAFLNGKAEVLTEVNLNKPWPMPDNSVDGVNLKDVIEHLENPVHTIQEIARILRPGGVAVISAPNMLNASSRVRFMVTGFYEGRKRPQSYAKPTGDAGNFYIPPLTLLHYLCAQSGMQIEKMTLGPPYWWNATFFAALLYPLFWFGTTAATTRVRQRSMLRKDRRQDVPDEVLAELKRKQKLMLRGLRKLLLSKEVLLARNLIFRARLTGATPFDV